MNAAKKNEPRVTPFRRCNPISTEEQQRRCAACPRIFTSPGQYMANRGSIVCRDVRGCIERAAAERGARRVTGGAR